jgi:hypothetical protein
MAQNATNPPVATGGFGKSLGLAALDNRENSKNRHDLQGQSPPLPGESHFEIC